MSRLPLRSAAGAAILVFVGAAYVLAARPEHHREQTTRQDESTPPNVNAPPRLQENSTVNAPLRTAPQIPAIDLNPPKKVETATFALG